MGKGPSVLRGDPFTCCLITYPLPTVRCRVCNEEAVELRDFIQRKGGTMMRLANYFNHFEISLLSEIVFRLHFGKRGKRRGLIR